MLKIFYWILLVALLGFLTAIVISKKIASKRGLEEKIVKEKRGNGNPLYFLFKIFSSVPLLKRIFNKTYRRVAILYPTNGEVVQKKTSEILFQGTIIFAAAVIFTILSSGGNIFYLCFSLVVIMFIFTQTINSSIKKADNEIMDLLEKYIEKIAENYHHYHIMAVAISKSMERAPYLIYLHLKKAYEITSSSNVKKKLDEYVGHEPNRYFLELLSIVATTKEFSDKKLENGKSTFSTGINQLKKQISDELLNRKKNSNAFRGLLYMTLIPVLLIKPIEAWADHTIEGLGQYYDGIYGIVAMIVIFIVSTICYQLVVTLRDDDEEVAIKEFDENSIWGRIIRIPLISSVSDRMINKNYTHYLVINNKMRSIGDHTGPKIYIAKKFLFGIAAFAVSIFLLVGADITSKVNTLNNFVDEFSDCVTPSEEYRDTMKKTAETYSQSLKTLKIDQTTEDELTKQIMKETEVTKETMARDVAKTVISRVRKYQNTYFKWYYLVVSAGIAFLAYMIPTWLLKFKSDAIKMRMEDEVIQFQSLMLILMHIDGTTLPIILEWLERFSYVFKADITKCRLNLSRGYRKALEKLKNDNESCESFTIFVDKLLTIENVGVEKAFQRMEVDRESQIENRKEDQATSRSKRSMKAGMLTFVPVIVEFIFYIIIPSALLSYNTYTTTMTMFK